MRALLLLAVALVGGCGSDEAAPQDAEASVDAAAADGARPDARSRDARSTDAAADTGAGSGRDAASSTDAPASPDGLVLPAPLVIVAGLVSPQRVAVDGTRVYVTELVAGGGALRSASKSGGATTLLLSTAVAPTALAVGDAEVFVAAGPVVLAARKDGTGSRTVARSAAGASGLAAAGPDVYWADGDGTGLTTLWRSTAGGAPVALDYEDDRPGGGFLLTAVAVDRDLVACAVCGVGLGNTIPSALVVTRAGRSARVLRTGGGLTCWSQNGFVADAGHVWALDRDGNLAEASLVDGAPPSPIVSAFATSLAAGAGELVGSALDQVWRLWPGPQVLLARAPVTVGGVAVDRALVYFTTPADGSLRAAPR